MELRRHLAAALLLVCAGCAGGTAGSASCVGPSLDDHATSGTRAPAPTVAPGDTIRIYGHWYTDTCNDTSLSRSELEPLSPVRLTLDLPGGGVVRTGSLHPAGAEMGFSADLVVPPGTPAGAASVQDDLDPPHVFTFAVGPDG